MRASKKETFKINTLDDNDEVQGIRFSFLGKNFFYKRYDAYEKGEAVQVFHLESGYEIGIEFEKVSLKNAKKAVSVFFNKCCRDYYFNQVIAEMVRDCGSVNK